MVEFAEYDDIRRKQQLERKHLLRKKELMELFSKALVTLNEFCDPSLWATFQFELPIL